MSRTIAKPISISRGHLDTCVAFAGLGPESLCSCLPAQRPNLKQLAAETRAENERWAYSARAAQEHVLTAPQHAIVDDLADHSEMAALNELLDQTQRITRVSVIGARVGALADWVSSTAWLFVLIVPLVVGAEVLIAGIASGRDRTPGGYAAAGALIVALVALGVRYGQRWHRRRTR